ncbi:MAG TPA: hypothetical protein VFR38_14595 [Gaiellaceae bacterium]|nr:hypothetical protein [Gaiellaceae bacterium]
MTRLALAHALGASVRVGDVRVGKIVGIYLDAERTRAIGLEVASAGGVRRFLPWVVASFENGEVRASSALHLLDAPDGYERHGAVALHDPSEVAGLSATVDGRVSTDSEPVSAELAMGTSLA